MSEYGTHKAHCFMIVQPENVFMGCKYGSDEDCPVYAERHFKQTSEVVTKKLEKRSIYEGEQWLDIKATVVNGGHFDIKVTGSQRGSNIDISMGREELQTLVDDLQYLLDSESGSRYE